MPFKDSNLYKKRKVRFSHDLSAQKNKTSPNDTRILNNQVHTHKMYKSQVIRKSPKRRGLNFRRRIKVSITECAT